RLLHHSRTGHGEHDGERVARHLYGAIIVLAVLVTADDHPNDPLEVAIVLAATIAILLGMEAYADILGREVDLRRPLAARERYAAARELIGVTGSVELPLGFLLLAGFGLISTGLAFLLAKASTLVVLFAYGYLAREQAGRSVLESFLTGLTVAGIGTLL